LEGEFFFIFVLCFALSDMTITINESITLELVDDQHAQPIFELVVENKDYLRPWLPWVDNMQSMVFIQNFIKGSQQRNKDGTESAFVILEHNKFIDLYLYSRLKHD